ncbi:DUF2306 domain-containing protein [Amnibacterium endophyticum]|uniref:DUF2306 domain-containing protein n=1 Tax=Amnibacterium endophyticum TaxID=2109337 RepID=A0ABW4LEJ4_9MICO
MDGWTLLVASHATAATLALVTGAAQLLRRRYGDRLHRWNGRVWVALMLFVSASSFWIRDLRPGHLSWIHVLSVVTLVSLVRGVVAIRRHDRITHAITMSATFAGMVGALIGVVAVPVRLVPRSFQADWLAMSGITAGIALAALAGIAALSFAARRLPHRPDRRTDEDGLDVDRMDRVRLPAR